MTVAEWMPILVATLGGGLLSAIVALLGYRMNKSKTIVEIEKLNLEIGKLKSEVDYKLSNVQEQLLYDGSAGMDGFHFEIHGTASVEKGTVAEGKHSFLNENILTIERLNREGRYEVRLTQYNIKGMLLAYIPKNLAIVGKRQIKVQYLAKVVNGAHRLRVVLKSTGNDGKWLANQDHYIDIKDQWEPVECFLRVDPSLDFYVRIDDLDVSTIPSSVQIRDLRVTEKVSS